MARGKKVFNPEEWEPKTKLGKMVKQGMFKNIDEVLESGMKILEPEIVDFLLPNLKTEVFEIRPTQRVTDSGRRTSFRVVVLVGDENGHVGYGVGKASEVGKAIDYATRDAKKNIIKVEMGCGSWECMCDLKHSIPLRVVGKESATEVELKPAPRGLRLAASDTIKAVLRLAGVKDVWGKTRRSTSNRYNVIVATFKALKQLGVRRQVPKKEVA